jgi:hypothetical protein
MKKLDNFKKTKKLPAKLLQAGGKAIKLGCKVLIGLTFVAAMADGATVTEASLETFADATGALLLDDAINKRLHRINKANLSKYTTPDGECLLK